jgi:methionine-rich copper-binding protein CopC
MMITNQSRAAVSSPRLVALAAMLMAVVSFALAGAVPASAHVVIQGAEPPADTTVATAPAQVVVLFSGEVAETGSTVTVTGPDGAAADNGDGHLDLNDLDRRTLVATLRPGLPDGVYSVNYTAYPADGHEPATGGYTFTVGAALDTATPAALSATPAATPASTPIATPAAFADGRDASTNDPGLGPSGLLLLVAAAAVVLLGGAAAILRASRRH